MIKTYCMKRLLVTILLFAATSPAFAQLYNPGEELFYRVSYRAKMFPNTEVGAVEVKTTDAELLGKKFYKVDGVGRTLPTYRWFYNLEDSYTIWVNPETLRPSRFESNLKEGDYTFQSFYTYDWEKFEVNTRWRSRKKPYQERTMELTPESMDAMALFFTMRAASADDFVPDEPATLQLVLQDTIRHLKYKFISRETKRIRNMGRFKTLKFECQLGTTEGYSFTDGTVFTLWLSDDENKIPLYIESPVRVGSINAYISGYKGLKYPLTSLIK